MNIKIRGERGHNDKEIVLYVMEADPNGFGALVSQGANINIFAVTAFF